MVTRDIHSLTSVRNRSSTYDELDRASLVSAWRESIKRIRMDLSIPRAPSRRSWALKALGQRIQGEDNHRGGMSETSGRIAASALKRYRCRTWLS